MTIDNRAFGAASVGVAGGGRNQDEERMQDQIASLLTETLDLGQRGQQLTADSRLLGSLPEFDSMAVVTVVTQLEEQFGVEFDDDEITANSFETLGALVELIRGKLE